MMPLLRGTSQMLSEAAAAAETGPSAGPLTSRMARDASARQVADGAAALWLDIGLALQPVIGRRGVASLFDRTLHLAAMQFPWLAALASGDAGRTIEIADLAEILAAQPPQIGMAASDAMFTSFRDLLATLIGSGLCERLLQSVWSIPSNALPAQDPKP